MDDYDLEAVHDAEIFPLMQRVIEICKRERIPMLASFAYARKGKETSFATTYMGRDGKSIPELRSALKLIREGFMTFAVTSKPTPP